jgi:hypothetical protein
VSGRELIAILLACWAIGLVTGIVATYGPHEASSPATVTGCRTEDSCSISYEHGRWHVRPDVP